MDSPLVPAHEWITTPNDSDELLIFNNQSIYLTDKLTLPLFTAIEQENFSAHYYCVAKTKTTRYLLVDSLPKSITTNFKAHHLKQIFNTLTEPLQSLSVLACHLHNWHETYRYCARCATTLINKIEERAKVCPQCELMVYPRISPCIIVLIRKGKQLLLARSPHFLPNVFSTIAGFIEPGETIEAAVHREVAEEVGITIKNLCYVMSQPWPFPDSLMLGFTADYDTGDIKIDNNEIEAADWFTIDNLPELPSKSSIARKLIDQHLDVEKSANT